jgi:DNA (cytosine-5)-methyltransferase 1
VPVGRWAYYNDSDPFVCEWLRGLIRAGQLPDGEVDQRAIQEVRAEDVRCFRECHFFAGIGGWAYALTLAGWPADLPVWTGSCPCQPFSTAGKGLGERDPRHLWPEWFQLIRECRPERIFGEQVAGAVAHGWLDAVSADLEAEGYAIGAVVLGAHSVGAPHLRQRLWFVAEGPRELGDAESCDRRLSIRQGTAASLEPRGPSTPGGLCDGFWSSCDWLPCRDGKARPVEPGTFPLADGVPSRVGRLRAYGNAIVPQVAAEFVRAYMEVRGL